MARAKGLVNGCELMRYVLEPDDDPMRSRAPEWCPECRIWVYDMTEEGHEEL